MVMARERGGAAPPMIWALATSLALHALLLVGRAPERAPASALSRLEVRLGVEGSAPADVVLMAPSPGAPSTEATLLDRPRTAGLRTGQHAHREGSAASAAPAPLLTPPADPKEAGPTGRLQAAEGPPVPLESSGARLVLPNAVRALYRQVASTGQRELVWRLDAGHYTLHWTERHDDGVVVSRVSVQGVLSYAGLLPLLYREVRAGRAERLWRFDWGAGGVEDDGAVSSKAIALNSGDLDPASLLMQIAIVHQVLPEAQRLVGVRLGVVAGGEVALRLIPALEASARARYELHGSGPDSQTAAVEMGVGEGLLPVQIEELGTAGRRVWQLAALEDLSVD